jgi:large subunit ribosomal protein L22
MSATLEIPTKKGEKTNERPGTRAQAKHIRMSASKARVVLNLIRGKDVQSAAEILQFSERDSAIVIAKLLRSAVANAEHNDGIPGDDLFVSACYADEGKTIRRFRPRARGRATRIRKRSCDITIIVSRMPDALLERRRAKDASRPGSRAARRAGQVAAEERTSRRRRRRGGAGEAAHDHEHEEPTAAEVAAAEDELDIVDQQAPAVAAAEEALDEEGAVTASADDAAADETAAEEAGVVDQQEAAADAAAEAEDASAADEDEDKN